MDNHKDQIIYFPKRNVPIVIPTRLLIICLIVSVVLGLWLVRACTAHAQQRDPLQSLQLDWQSLATAQGHVATGIQDLATAYQAAKPKADKFDALDVYLKACGDQPGCTVPVPEAQK